MEKNIFTHIEVKLCKHIENFESRRKFYKKRYHATRLSIFACGFITTITIGLSVIPPGFNPYAKDIALIFSALGTTIGAIDAFFDNRGLWLQYTQTCNDLKSLESELQYVNLKEADSIDTKTLDSFFDRLQLILQSTNKKWLGIQSTEET